MAVDYDKLNVILDEVERRTSGRLLLEVVLWRRFMRATCERVTPSCYQTATTFIWKVVNKLDQLDPDTVIDSIE